jgi:hypothetical protein
MKMRKRIEEAKVPQKWLGLRDYLTPTENMPRVRKDR